MSCACCDHEDEDYEPPKQSLKRRFRSFLIRKGILPPRPNPFPALSEALKELYLPAMQEESNKDSLLLSKIQSASKRHPLDKLLRRANKVITGSYVRSHDGE